MKPLLVLNKYLPPMCLKKIHSLPVPNLFRRLCLRRIRRPVRKIRNRNATSRMRGRWSRREAIVAMKLARRKDTKGIILIIKQDQTVVIIKRNKIVRKVKY